jgi:NAD(P)-dependent dehydrogenase (short-subunit alcohol dehydrogenase family)
VALMVRVIAVSGAASGIGAALTRLLAEQGDHVIGLDVKPAPAAHTSLVCDLSDPASIAAAAQTIDSPLQGLANIAGLPGTYAPERILAVNFLGLRALTLALLPKLAPGSAIVNVSSVTAARCGWSEAELGAVIEAQTQEDALALIRRASIDGAAAYELSKKLVNVWTPLLSAATQARGLRTAIVSPGPVDTPILDDFKTSIGEDRIAAAAQLVGRHGAADDIAQVVRFLLSPAAGWINGAEIKADGGYHALRGAAQGRLSDPRLRGLA